MYWLSTKNTILTFGKYKNKSISYIQDHDPEYVKWLITQKNFPIKFKSDFVKYYQLTTGINPNKLRQQKLNKITQNGRR
jgi:uncharacterized protein (DUF3820 family)